MKYTPIILLLLIACQRSEIISDEIFGLANESTDAVPVEAVLAEPETYFNHSIAVRGTVHEVCQMEGCWLMLRSIDTGHGLRVHAEIKEDGEYAFTVPKDISGRHTVVFGTLSHPDKSHEAHDHMDAPSEIPILSLTAVGVRLLPELTI